MCNLSVFSQVFRIIIGIILIAIAWYGPQTSILPFQWISFWRLGWLGFIPLLSGIAAFCPVYAVFGFGHKPEEKNKPEIDSDTKNAATH